MSHVIVFVTGLAIGIFKDKIIAFVKSKLKK